MYIPGVARDPVAPAEEGVLHAARHDHCHVLEGALRDGLDPRRLAVAATAILEILHFLRHRSEKGSSVKFGGFEIKFGSVFGQFVELSVVKPIKYDEIRSKSEFKSKELDG